ncbi:hypothetical protein DFJ58DRAFT_268274 [Suillus subalutaceus]|uniref:uncharacterized protein n=1 Tax=Suillus subalutaceus TaxID=48586 RepID=UPI001B86F459|nr:uncharacterized protein DFJ58DRAFT_268274 [Suillus subalutaceus]KAG1830667.1 hypothetical protein DFJ58DRAFT_268274 [Suillus subalutaceus]
MYANHREEMQSRLLSVASGSSPLVNYVQLISGDFRSYVAMNLLIIDHLAVVIIFEHSFYVFDKRRYLQDKQKSDPSFYVALEQYMASPHAAGVREAVMAAVQAYQEATKTAVKGKMPAWMVKLLSERSQKEKKSLAKAELTKTILEISLNHRLSRP